MKDVLNSGSQIAKTRNKLPIQYAKKQVNMQVQLHDNICYSNTYILHPSHSESIHVAQVLHFRRCRGGDVEHLSLWAEILEPFHVEPGLRRGLVVRRHQILRLERGFLGWIAAKKWIQSCSKVA